MPWKTIAAFVLSEQTKEDQIMALDVPDRKAVSFWGFCHQWEKSRCFNRVSYICRRVKKWFRVWSLNYISESFLQFRRDNKYCLSKVNVLLIGTFIPSTESLNVYHINMDRSITLFFTMFLARPICQNIQTNKFQKICAWQNLQNTCIPMKCGD